MPWKSDTKNAAAAGGTGRWSAAAGIVATLAIFAAAGAWPVPDVNETAYLTKARHEADPSFGRGDFFLETPEAHGVFYRVIGPLAAAMPLDRAAWIGRWLGWLALAVGFHHAIVPLVPGWWPRVLAAAVYSLALRHTTAAGEWVIGGCEAKVFAWAFVLAAAGEVARGRFARAWLLLGAATAFHPVVGGWGLVTLAIAWGWSAAIERKAVAAAPRSAAGPALLLGGVALAAAGVVPALGLSAGADAATRAAAVKIYVVERLPHHLLLRTFADGMVARHVLAILVWWLLATLVADRAGPRAEARARLNRFTVAALSISLAGCLVSLAEPLAPRAVYGLLRYYWFRFGEGILPLALAATAAAAIATDDVLGRLLPGRRATGPGFGPAAVRAAVATLLLVDLVGESRHWPLPGRTALAARADGKVDAASWADACDWVAAHTPADACFLTPRGSASFTWRTGRREVVGWKNSPQDAMSLVEWRRRITDCFSRDGGFANMERSTAALGFERLRAVADRYGADHAIVPADLPALAELPCERLYANRGYAVYRLVAAVRPTDAAAPPPGSTP
jgi:hypothetical protein